MGNGQWLYLLFCSEARGEEIEGDRRRRGEKGIGSDGGEGGKGGVWWTREMGGPGLESCMGEGRVWHDFFFFFLFEQFEETGDCNWKACCSWNALLGLRECFSLGG